MPVALRAAENGDAAAIVAIQRELDDARVISLASARHQRATRPPEAEALELVAVDGDEVVGFGICARDMFTSTPGAAWAFIGVTPARRREGIGSALTEPLEEHLRAIGAIRVTAFIRQTDEGERWANARGWSRAISGPLIALDPRSVTPPALGAGFSCVALSELTAEDVYDTMCEAALDEPSAQVLDDISLDDFRREWNDPDLDHTSSAAVMHDGRVAAFALVNVVGDRAQHFYTGTARAYRGRGLATAAKRAALVAAAARGVTRITTSNAEENAAMRAINRQLGFEPIGEHVILAREL